MVGLRVWFELEVIWDKEALGTSHRRFSSRSHSEENPGAQTEKT